MRIVHGVQDYDKYFELKNIALDFLDSHKFRKCTATVQCIAYGAPISSLGDQGRSCLESIGLANPKEKWKICTIL